MSDPQRPPRWYVDVAADPQPPRAEREVGPAEVNLPLDVAARPGAFDFEFWGRHISVAAAANWDEQIIRFAVPELLSGVLFEASAWCPLPWYNDEFIVELFVDGRPQLAAAALNEASPLPRTVLSADPRAPTRLYVPLEPQAVVILAVGRGLTHNEHDPSYPTGLPPSCDGMLRGRFWPRTLGRSRA